MPPKTKGCRAWARPPRRTRSGSWTSPPAGTGPSVSVEGVFFRSMAFSPDGRYLATSLLDGTVRVYDAATGRERLPRLGREPSVGPPPQPGTAKTSARRLELIDCLAFSPDGSILAGGSSQAASTPSPGSLYLWDFATRPRAAPDRRVPRRPGDGCRSPPTAGRSPRRVAGSRCRGSGTWPPAARPFRSPGTSWGSARWPSRRPMGRSSPAATTVRSGSWDPATGRELGLVARFNSVLTMAIAPDGKTLLVGGQFGDPALWSVPEQRELRRIPGVGKDRHGPPGRVFPGRPDRGLRPEDLGRRLGPAARPSSSPRTSRGASLAPCTMFYTPDGKRVITVEPGAIRTWDIAIGRRRLVRPSGTKGSGGDHVALSCRRPIRWRLAACPTCRGWSTAAGPVDPRVGAGHGPRGREVAGAREFRQRSGPLARRPAAGLVPAEPAGRPNRNIYEPQPQDPTIRIWDVAKGRELRRLEGHRGTVNAVVFTPDGRSLISAGEDATALVWDVSDLRDR